MANRLDLCSIEGLSEAVARFTPGSAMRLESMGTFDGTYCPACNAERRMMLVCLFWEDRWAPGAPNRFGASVEGAGGVPVPAPQAAEKPDPALFVAVCVQCDGAILLLVFNGPNGIELVTLPSTYGGLSTPHTPEAVAYYLDQAQRAQAVGALSAAVTMYRAALEHVLEEQGYQERMLGPKIKAILEDNDPPPWRDELDPDYLTVVKDLGNASIHTNEGQIEKQRVFEVKLIREVQALFAELLDTIYEAPERKRSRLSTLKSAVDSFKP